MATGVSTTGGLPQGRIGGFQGNPESGASPQHRWWQPHRPGWEGYCLSVLSFFFLKKQRIQLWRDDFKDGRRLSATGRLSGSCAVMSLPRFHHYLLRDVGASLPALTCSNTKTLSSGSSAAKKPY